LITQRLFHAPLLWKRAAGDLFVEAIDYSPCLPHEEASSFFLTYALCFSCSRADERPCGLGGETSTGSEEKRCLKWRKEDFREAMQTREAGVLSKTLAKISVFLDVIQDQRNGEEESLSPVDSEKKLVYNRY
jgi:hypothetical protein